MYRIYWGVAFLITWSCSISIIALSHGLACYALWWLSYQWSSGVQRTASSLPLILFSPSILSSTPSFLLSSYPPFHLYSPNPTPHHNTPHQMNREILINWQLNFYEIRFSFSTNIFNFWIVISVLLFIFYQVNDSLKFLNFPMKSKIPTWLREIILSSSEDHLRKFLVFVTGSPSITPTTYQKIEINVRCQARSGSLPIAHTCFYHLGKHDCNYFYLFIIIILLLLMIVMIRSHSLTLIFCIFSFFYHRYTRLPWQRDIAGETDVCNRPCEHFWNRLIRLHIYLF